MYQSLVIVGIKDHRLLVKKINMLSQKSHYINNICNRHSTIGERLKDKTILWIVEK